jgi:hypothetical protein
MAKASAVVSRSIPHPRTLERILHGLLALAVVFAVAVLCLGLFQPLLDHFFSR